MKPTPNNQIEPDFASLQRNYMTLMELHNSQKTADISYEKINLICICIYIYIYIYIYNIDFNLKMVHFVLALKMEINSEN